MLCSQDTFVIRYTVPDGVQGRGHPNPGVPYTGHVREAFLPNNADGLRVLNGLKTAFFRGLVFKIGKSLTSGADNTVASCALAIVTTHDGSTVAYPSNAVDLGWYPPQDLRQGWSFRIPGR